MPFGYSSDFCHELSEAISPKVIHELFFVHELSELLNHSSQRFMSKNI